MALLLLVPLSVPAAWAAQTRGEQYGPFDKLGRGFANMTAGFLALPGSIADEVEQDGAEGIPAGVGLGVLRAIARELAGVYDFVTFPIASPKNFAPVMEPAYPWDYFNETSGTIRHASAVGRGPAAPVVARAEHAAEAPPVGQCLSSADVRGVQRRLKDRGYAVGPVDGVFGPRTRSALREFQKDKNVQANGRLDLETLAAMELGRESATSGTRGEHPSGTGRTPDEQEMDPRGTEQQ